MKTTKNNDGRYNHAKVFSYAIIPAVIAGTLLGAAINDYIVTPYRQGTKPKSTVEAPLARRELSESSRRELTFEDCMNKELESVVTRQSNVIGGPKEDNYRVWRGTNYIMFEDGVEHEMGAPWVYDQMLKDIEQHCR